MPEFEYLQNDWMIAGANKVRSVQLPGSQFDIVVAILWPQIQRGRNITRIIGLAVVWIQSIGLFPDDIFNFVFCDWLVRTT